MKNNVPLDSESVCVWKIDLDWNGSATAAVRNVLSADEEDRAARFHQEPDKRRFIIAHAVLRLILARYLEADPREITFVRDAYGKPRLQNNKRGLDIRFNLAHSEGVALCALTIGQEVGVDLEAVRPDRASLEIARTFFAPPEFAALLGLTGDDFVSAFYRCWTRKEAYIKASGPGLSLPLASFVVSVCAETKTQRLVDPFRAKDAWMLIDIDVGENFAAALAVAQSKNVPRIQRFDYGSQQALRHIGSEVPNS